MQIRRLTAGAALVLLLGAVSTFGQSKTAQDVTTLLREFIDAAGRGDPPVFDKFFADDVVYTRATGAVITKNDIMSSLKTPPPESAGTTTYSAEDIVLHEYGDTVVVAFRLTARTERPGGNVQVTHYRNTGTFLRRNRRWQVVAWQATKVADAATTN